LVSSVQVFQPQFYTHFSFFPCYMPRLSPVWLDHPNNIWCSITIYETPLYSVFSSLPPLYPSYVQIFSSSPCSHTPSMHVFSLIRETKFHTDAKQQIELQLCIS
jgi:hypothetical protein